MCKLHQGGCCNLACNGPSDLKFWASRSSIGMESALILILMSFFDERQMFVKWHGTTSSINSLKGGGPQGSTMGILDAGVPFSLSNNNADNIPKEDRFKYVDDLTLCI